ncbi:TetR/AcrR family transcriptional regulator [Rhodococcus chondri]|uniref:Helix-turn-helix domain-containing protein n=1 Tax=Rhodococcus chondri TaxID=3065941 RepID=A0ABU7JQP4_9NOCA|nr:helix-turn-helix domain-containing protein [Rhodococcus sp. CC-R104]MEE2032338.1 helix-turn-helix domain-containing protein [Rhodococcus sp. CC-R104]
MTAHPEAPAASDDDPRKVRSRARLLDAATTLLATGGADAVTIDAVTTRAGVGRATLYRHFANGPELVAAAFARLIPPAPAVPEHLCLRDQLVELLVAQARIIEEAPVPLAAMCWLGMGPSLDPANSPADSRTVDRPELQSLRSQLVERYRLSFDRVLRSDAARDDLGEFDCDFALVQLLGPIVFNRLVTLPPIDRRACEQIVDDFLVARRAAREANVTGLENRSRPGEAHMDATGESP